MRQRFKLQRLWRAEREIGKAREIEAANKTENREREGNEGQRYRVFSQGKADSNKWFWLGSAALRSKILCCQSAWQKTPATATRRIHWDCKGEEEGTTSCLCMCICVRVSLSICIAYLAAIWPAKQYHESEKSDNENVLSMATMKGAGGENSD